MILHISNPSMQSSKIRYLSYGFFLHKSLSEKLHQPHIKNLQHTHIMIQYLLYQLIVALRACFAGNLG